MPEITSAPIDRKPDTDKRSWHRKASRPVSGWLVALLIVAVANPWIPQSRWLLVHMVTLGVATTSIMVWGQYFTEAILHTTSPTLTVVVRYYVSDFSQSASSSPVSAWW